jgi:cell division transport system permease protein
MSLLNAKRVWRSGVQNFFRNGLVSFSSVVIMTITLFIISSTILLAGFLNYSLEKVKEKVDINVYFVTTASEPDILAVKKSLETLPEVSSVEYISSDQALLDFKEKHSGDALTLQAIDELGYNPLGASLNIRAKDPSDYAGIATFLEGNSTELLSSGGSKIIDKINYSQNKVVIDRLTSIINSTNMLGLWLAIIFVIISIIITFNTIRLTIFMAKDEISVMRLVGASNKYVKGPFMVSGILCGLISAFIIIVLFAVGTFLVNKYYGSYFVGFDLFGYYMSNFFSILGVIGGGGIILGGLSSYLAARKYLKN